MEAFRCLICILICIGGINGWWNGYNSMDCKYGKFDNDPPFDNVEGRIPWQPDELGVQFYLNTKTSNGYQILHMDDKTQLNSSFYQFDKPTKIIIHGFNDNVFSGWEWTMVKTLLKSFDGNVIRANWAEGADPNYYQAASNTRMAACMIGELIDTLVELGAQYTDFHIIGHSLGAHVAGQAGQVTKSLVGRITGMDPAGPCFKNTDPRVRLDRYDARFVDVIHTDAEALLAGGLGLYHDMGDVDIFPWGGHDQDGCPKTMLGAIGALFTDGLAGEVVVLQESDLTPIRLLFLKTIYAQELESGIKDGISCSHSRAYEYLISSIEDCIYDAVQCNSYDDFKAGKCSSNPHNRMGLHTSSSSSAWGRFYLRPSGGYPYCW